MNEINNTNTRPPFFPQTHRTRSQGQLQNFQQQQNAAAGTSTTGATSIESLTREQFRGMDATGATGAIEANDLNRDAKVEIPNTIKDFSQIKKAVDQSRPLERGEKIAALKDQIQRGEYRIDEGAIANKMLEQEF